MTTNKQEPVTVNDKTFRQEVIECDETVLVDFYADWVSPGGTLGADANDIRQKLHGNVKVCRVPVNESFRTAEEYSIRTFPTFLLFRQGKLVDTLAGKYSEEETAGRLRLMLKLNEQ